MILTCPACGTQYVVKDGAIPPGGRKVRCASCRHSWHQDPEEQDALELSAAAAIPVDVSGQAENSDEQWTGEEPPEDEPRDASEAAQGPAIEDAEYEPIGGGEPAAAEEPMVDGPPEPDMQPVEPHAHQDPRNEWIAPASTATVAPAGDDDEFSPFARRESAGRQRRSPMLRILLLVLLVAVLVAAFWFLAPPAWKARLGIGDASETPLQLMMTHSDRQKLESGQEFLTVSGRVINPTGERQIVPPITAELRNANGQIVHRWAIAPPARSLDPGASATFNSANVNVPEGGEELTVSLGAPRA